MSENSSPASKNRKSSRFSPFQKHSSSPGSLSRRHSPLPGDSSSRRLDVLAEVALSSIPAHSTASSRFTSAQPSLSHQRPISHFEVSAHQSYSSTQLAIPSAPLLHQGQASTYEGSNHAAGTLNGAHNFIMKDPVFVENNTTAGNFMEKLLQHTIIGAEFDSSARDPPPRCHPGTRLAIIQRCLDFITQCQDEGKLRWVVGPAGVGKSAVMQMVTDKAPDGVIFASVFLSVNGRRDGTKTILTIAYQLAVKCGPYRQFIQDQISLDPSQLRKCLSVQFNKFIVEPFMLNHLFEPSRRFLVVIDGLDECDNPSTQEELLGLITDFCITYPTSPIAWIVASRPESHITAFFDQADIKLAYTKEEIEVNSDEAREEVERYLRDELKKIQSKYATLRHKQEWPSEHEFTRIASSAGGLFAYAATVVRYIDDPKCRNPAAQLRRVLETNYGRTKDDIAGNYHPMFHLDALYKRILSEIPANTMINTRKLLAGCSILKSPKFRQICNIMGLTEADAYGAICHLQAVMKIPEPDKADDEYLLFYHKSFEDFLFDSTRSGFSDGFDNETTQLLLQASLRIIGEVPYDADAMASGDVSFLWGGSAKGRYGNITLSWPGDERFQLSDYLLRAKIYESIMYFIYIYFEGDSPDGSISLFHVLTTRLTVLGHGFPYYRLGACAFGRFRAELTELGKLKQVPLWALDYAAICGYIHLRFTSPIEPDVKFSDSWDPSCEHELEEIGGLQQRRGCSIDFGRYFRDGSCTEDEEDIDIPRFHTVTRQQSHQACFYYHVGDGCIHCSRRLARHFMNNQDLLATVFVDGTQLSYVEFSFVDPDDGVSEWRYRFCHSGLPTSIYG